MSRLYQIDDIIIFFKLILIIRWEIFFIEKLQNFKYILYICIYIQHLDDIQIMNDFIKIPCYLSIINGNFITRSVRTKWTLNVIEHRYTIQINGTDVSCIQHVTGTVIKKSWIRLFQQVDHVNYASQENLALGY